MKTFWKNRQEIASVGLAIMAMTSIASAIVLAYQNKTPAGALCAALGLLLLAFVQLSRFKKVRGIGFEAELWEDKQREAEALIERTKDLLGILATTLLTAAPRMNRMMRGFSRRELIDLSSKVEALLGEAGVPAASREGLLSEIDLWTAWDLTQSVIEPVHQAIHNRLGTLRDERARRFGSPITDIEGHNLDVERSTVLQRHDFSANELRSLPLRDWPTEIRRRVEALPEFSDVEKTALLAERREELLDLEAWVAGRQVRRPDVFFAEL